MTAAFWSYAVGQFVNGMIADRIGGKRSMLLGAAGTVILNILFGAASLWGVLGLFIAIRLVDGYMQSMGAPGMVKINAAWFSRPERGGFAGIFGFMIQMGQIGIHRYIGPVLLTGSIAFIMFGQSFDLSFEPLHWRYLFWVPSMITAAIAVIMALVVKQSPEEAGFSAVGTTSSGRVLYEYTGDDHSIAPSDAKPTSTSQSHDKERVPWDELLRTVLSHPGVWFCAVAYFCTGFVRYGVLNWYLRFLEDYGVSPDYDLYKGAALGVALVAIIGSLGAGFISDLIFKGRRATVAAFLYLLETAVILVAAYFVSQMNGHIDSGEVVVQKVEVHDDAKPEETHEEVVVVDRAGNRLAIMPGIALATLFIVLIALTCNSTHSIIGTAAAMDIGGRKMSGFASGVIDSFQYIGGGLTGFFVGWLIDDYGYTVWMLSMAPAGVIGGICMLVYRLYERRTAPATST